MAELKTPLEAFNIVKTISSIDALKTIYVSPNFTWAEVFTNRSLAEAKAAPLKIFENALFQAGKLEKIRAYLRLKLGKGVSIIVTSWYRPSGANASVGGAKGSSHLTALATDFIIPGFGDVTGNRKIQALLIPMKDDIGFCLEITNGKWTHVDARSAHFVFENKGNGQYPVLGLEALKAFILKYRG